MMDALQELLKFFQQSGETRRVVLLGSILLGISSGVLGSFAFLRRQSLLGDAMAHAALPGVCLAFLMTGVRNPFFFLIGAMCTGVIGGLLVIGIERNSRVKYDAAIGLILSVFFAFGIILLTIIQQSGMANQAGLETFLFGNAATLLKRDVYIIGGTGILLVGTVGLFFKEFKLLTFDPNFLRSTRYPFRLLDVLLTSLIVAAVMIGLQAVGVVLMVGMLIIPAAAARQWTSRLFWMIVVAATIGAAAGLVGTVLSGMYPKMPSGPVMVIIAGLFLVGSILFSPKRGLIREWLQQYRMKRKVRLENALKLPYKFLEEREGDAESFTADELMTYSGQPLEKIQSVLQLLNDRSFVRTEDDTNWTFTPAGRREATDVVRRHRLWELYLSNQVQLPADHVHRDADEMEHVLSDDLIERIEETLAETEKDPHGRPIPDPDQVGHDTSSIR